MPFDLSGKTEENPYFEQPRAYAAMQPCSGVTVIRVQTFGGGAAASSPDILLSGAKFAA